MKTTALISLILILFIGITNAQSVNDFSEIQEFSIKSTILDEERNFTLYLPNDYVLTDNSYPVLYLLDGRTHFQHASGAVNFLSTQGSMPNIIVVSVHNVDRNRDFSPAFEGMPPNTGGAEKFLGFLSEELIPYMKDQYRTSGFDMLMGHSFGGTFAVYSLINKPGIFDGYITVSPYLQYAENYLVTEAEKALKPFGKGGRYFYMTIGDEPPYYDALSKFSSLLKEKTDGTIDFKYVKLETENHATIPYISLFNGLRFIFTDFQLPQEKFQQGLKAIDGHYAGISSKYGFKVETSEQVINALGYNKLQGGEIEKAISIFTENVKRYPGSANVYDSLGEAYENNSQLEMAEKNYHKAYELGLKLKDVNTPIYKINMERVQQ